MADLNFAAFSFTAKPAITVATNQSNKLYSRACHAPSPAKLFKLAKPRRRRNSLLPKILPKPRENPSIDPITPREAQIAERNDERADADSVEIDETVSVASVGHDRATEDLLLSGASGRSIAVRYGMYMIGAFLFQNVLAVWILGNGQSNEKDQVSNSSDSDRTASSVNAGPSGERIEEIRAMARRARRDEKSVGEESLSSRSKKGVEKAIGNRLQKLKKSSNGGKDQLLGNGSATLGKKLRLRSSMAELGESSKEKGFGSSEKKNISKGRRIVDEASGLSEGENGDIQKSRLSQNVQKKSGNGVLQEGKFGSPVSRGKNGSSIRQEAEKKLASLKLLDKKPGIEADSWWLNLPYVLVVLMRRDSDPEDVKGIYALKRGSEDESSYTVAFEDRGDAKNFCFLLGSFLEDLGDVRTGVIPLSVKELEEAVRSENGNVIVVRKGQLRLYAGQPFEDVETALHALVEETQSVR